MIVSRVQHEIHVLSEKEKKAEEEEKKPGGGRGGGGQKTKGKAGQDGGSGGVKCTSDADCAMSWEKNFCGESPSGINGCALPANPKT